MERERVVPKGIVFPFILLTTLFFAWAIPNNLTDTMLAAFKRIMSLSDTKTAWIQIACYLFGYGFFAIPGAIFIKRHSYKSGVMLGLGLYALGAFLFYPAMLSSESSIQVSFAMYLLAILILFAGLSILETSTNSYVLAIGPSSTATRRLNLAQSFNPFGAIVGVVISQVFVLSQLNTLSASERAALPVEELLKIRSMELNAVTTTYVVLGLFMLGLLIAIYLTKMPKLKEEDKNVDFGGTLKRLAKNKQYVWAVVAQFFYVGAQIAVWSFIIRYTTQQLHLDNVIALFGKAATKEEIIIALRNVEPIAKGFYNFVEFVGLDVLLPRTAEQAGATYYIISLVLFVVFRFICTGLMQYISHKKLLTILSSAAATLCIVAVYSDSFLGVYALVAVSACMSLMFPTIYGLGIGNLGKDTKIGGSGMIMAIAGAAVLTQIQGVVSDSAGSIKTAFWVPASAFMIIAYYAAVIVKKQNGK